MCGIFCALSAEQTLIPTKLATLLQNRGPNINKLLHVPSNKQQLTFASYVLWQQGVEPCIQPIEQANIVLLFNGDIYNIVEQKHMADSEWLAHELSKCKDDLDIITLFKHLTGPFSLVFYDKQHKNLYFGRDSLGRNSLIIEKDKTDLRLTSTTIFDANANDTKISLELPSLGLFKINLFENQCCTLLPWTTPTAEWHAQAEILADNFNWTLRIASAVAPNWLSIAKQPLTSTYDLYNLCGQRLTSLSHLLQNRAVCETLDRFAQLLENSVRVRVQKTPQYCSNCMRTLEYCQHAKVAVLFSGGIDCSILARLADKFVAKNDSIELINVAFERVQSHNTPEQWSAAPDRISARASFEQLQYLCPARNWIFIEVNVTRAELVHELNAHIKHLIYPLDTVLDESVGSAFWFAARGYGAHNIKSTARVIIIGSGADELFGGYMRHRNAYRRCTGSALDKQAAVEAELELDWQRMPSRNLARDDRVIADSGKTSRAPYIEEHLVHFVRNLTPSQRCCFILPEGIGDKLLLRLYGQQLGLSVAMHLKKRAIQFGSRIADKKQNAKDQSQYLKFQNT